MDIRKNFYFLQGENFVYIKKRARTCFLNFNFPKMSSLATYNSKKIYRSLLQAGLVLLFLYAVSLYSFLLFRSLIEFFGAVVSFGIFIIAWNSRKITNNNFLIFIGLAYLFVGSVGIIRTLIYPGLAIISGNDINISQQLRITGLFLESGSFLVALFYLDKKVSIKLVFLAYLAAFLLIFLSIFSWKIFPTAFVFSVGETAFKKAGDLFGILAFFISGAVVVRKREKMDQLILYFLLLMVIFQIFSIAIHTPFIHAYSFGNLASQSFRFMAFYFLYKAVIETGLMNPYRVLFKSLKDREGKLEKYRNQLEIKVSERTADLARMNAELRREIFQRKTAEKHLIESYNHLGTINRKISMLFELNKSSLKKRKRDILDYMLNSAIKLSGASLGVLYFRNNHKFYSVLSVGVGQVYYKDINHIDSGSCQIIRSLMAEKAVIRGRSEQFDLGRLSMGLDTRYFTAIPLMVNWKIKGMMFLGFGDRKSMDVQEVEFLDVFASNASSALSNAGILK